MTHSTLAELIAAANQNSEQVRELFGALTPAQLNWKPAPERWSVGQCLDHLVTTNATYFPTFDAILAGSRKRTFWEKLPVLPGFFGKMLLKSVSPDSARQLKAPQVFQPTASSVEGDIVRRFLAQQEQIIRFLKASEKLKTARIILTSPAAGFITYSLLDTFRIIVAHEQRHLLQAKRVMATAGFGGVL